MDVFLDFDRKPLSFENPSDIIVCNGLDGLPRCFAAMENALARGLFLAGFLSYEAGYGMEEKLRDVCPDVPGFPLLMMGCYRSPGRESLLKSRAGKNWSVRDLGDNMSRPFYDSAIGSVREAIARGDVYQITYCLKRQFSWSGAAEDLYRVLYREQPVPYPAFIRTRDFRIACLSPELFFRKNGEDILTKPMKGTWPRGTNGLLDDGIQRIRFQRDEKNRAENVMITDLLRNDLGRIGRRVRVPRLFEVTPYRHCFQMTSTVTAQIPSDLPLSELFRAIFPSGSVTGAPKIRAMEMIRRLEPEPRRIYTGAIGYITPGRDMVFNIPIRTLLLRGETGEMGVGGGIVWDSTAEGEWREGEWKSEFLKRVSDSAPD